MVKPLVVVALAVIASAFWGTPPMMATTVTFTNSGKATWICPTGVAFVAVECYGGGGGAGAAGVGQNTSGSGGGGAYASNTVVVTSGTSYNLTVGAGGTGSKGSPPPSGGNGGASYFGNTNAGSPNGALVLAVGGNGSTNVTGNNVEGPGAPAQTSGCIGSLIFFALPGGDAPGNGSSGAGPTGPAGGGAGGLAPSNEFYNGVPGLQPGGGGSGGYCNGGAQSQGHGGAGGTGLVVITYRLTPTVTLAVTNSPQSYTGSGQAAGVVMVTHSVPGTVINVQYNGSANLPVTAGSYAVTADFVPNDTSTYSILSGLSAGNFVINKTNPSFGLAVVNPLVTYDGTPKSATVIIRNGSTTGMVSNVLTGGALNQSNNGTYQVTATFVPNDTNDYNILSGLTVGSLQIAPLAAAFYSNFGPFTYDGTAHSPAVKFTGSTGAATTNYVGFNVSYHSVNPPTNAGTYYLSNTLAGDANYAGATNSLTFTINPAPLAIQAGNVGKPYGQVMTFAGTEFTLLNPLYGSDTVTSVAFTSAGIPANMPTGPYPLVPTNAVGSGLGNYSISFNLGTLTVTNALTSLYVAPGGSGTIFSPAQPGALSGARNYVRGMGTNLTADVVIYLMGGTYQLTNSFQLQENATNHDSGTGGHNIIYQNVPGQTPVISGGMVVTNWTLFDPVTNIWRAYVGTGVNSRQLYVNEVRAIRARSPIYSGTDGGVLPGFGTASGGFWTTNLAMQNWRNVTNIEVVERHHWQHTRCPIASISGTNIVMQQPCWSVLSGYGRTELNWIENAYELMVSPGMWYLDQAAGYLYYIPRTGENMPSAVVVLPVVEKLIDAQGTPFAKPVHNVILSGLTFEYGTWLQPGTTNGYADYQTCIYWTLLPAGYAETKTLGNISFQTSANIQITNCVFEHLGGAALDFGGGAHNNLIIGNHIEDISSAGILVGEVTDGETTDTNQMSDGNVVQDNFIRRPGQDYEDAPGICFLYTRNSIIAHNDTDNGPYDGINAGFGGWINGTPTYMAHNQIYGNYVGRVMQTLFDGGSFYSMNHQPNSWMVGNYFKDCPDNGIYFDGQTTGYNVVSNVLDNLCYNGVRWILNYGVTNWVSNTICNGNSSDFDGPPLQITNTVYVKGQFWTPAAQQIIVNAGLEPAFAWIKSPEFMVNDTDPAFDVVPSDWTYAARARSSRIGEYASDVHTGANAGDTLQYTFTASGISWMGDLNVDASTNVAVYLDGNFQGNVNCWSSTLVPQVRLFTASNLPAGPHTLKLINNHAGGTMYVDAFAVVPNNFWLTATTNAGSASAGIAFSNVIQLDTFGTYAGTTTFSASGLPAGATASFNPPAVTGAGFTVMTIVPGASSPVGNYEVAVTGIGGGATNIATVSLAVVSAGGGPTVIYNTVGTNTWTCPAGVNRIQVECWGGGGAGGSVTNGTTANNIAAGSGGGGAYAMASVAVTPGMNYTCAIPPVATPPAGGFADQSRASNGSAVSFAGDTFTLTANGGNGGQNRCQSGSGNLAGTLGNGGGTTANASVSYAGGNGRSAPYTGKGNSGGTGASDLAAGNTSAGYNQTAGPAGSDANHNGGYGGSGGLPGVGANGGTPGGGGGAAGTQTPNTINLGGNGAPGQIILTYYPYGVVKANNASNLNLSGSWLGGTPPTASQLAVWDNTVANTNTVSLAADTNWAGIVIIDPGGPVTINAGNTLTLNASLGGNTIEMSSATANLALNCPLVLGGNNTWSLGSGATLTVGGQVVGNYAITNAGLGTVVLSGNNTYSGGTTLTGGQLNLNYGGDATHSAIGTGALTINGGTLDNTSSGDVTLQPNNPQNWNGNFAYAGSAHNLNLGTGAVTLRANIKITVSANNLTVGGTIGDGGHAYGLTAAGGGALTLTGASTYSGATTINSGGTLYLAANGSISGSATINLAAGAILDVSQRADQTLTLAAGQTLAGNGTVNGSLIASPNAILAPGTGACGALTVTNAVRLLGTTVMKLNKSWATNDVLVCAQTINYGGTLSLANLGGTLNSGDTFKLFYANTCTGAFNQILPAVPRAGLAWDIRQLNAGILAVKAAIPGQPQIGGLSLSSGGAGLVLQGSGGPTNGSYSYWLLSSTNLALPLTNWSIVATNAFDAYGNFSNQIPLTPGMPQQFYRLQLP